MTDAHNSSRLRSALSSAVIAAIILVTPLAARAQTTPAQPAGTPIHLTLPSAIEMAIAHDRKLQLARLSVRDGQEQKRIAQSHYYPELSNSSAVHHITSLEGVVFPQGAFSHGTSAGPVPAETLRIDQGASTSYTSGTGLEQPLTQMFKIHAGVKAAEADLNTARIQAEDTQDAIALEVHQLYYNYLVEQLSESAAQDAVTASQTAEEENQKGVREGHLLTDVELGSRAELLDKQRAVLVAKLTLDDLSLQLDDVLGLSLGTKLDLDPDSLGEPPALPSRAEAIDEVLQKSPAVLGARQTVAKSKAGVASARDAYIPNITGMARYSYQSGLPFLQHNFGIFGASFSYDLFDGGAREASLRDARVKLSMAETQLAQTENDVRIQVSSAYDKVEQLQELLRVSQLTLEAREETFRIQSQRALVNAQLASGVAAAHSAVTTAKLNVLTSQLNLYLVQNDIRRQLGETPQ